MPGREKDDLVAELMELPGPVMSGGAGLEQDGGLWLLDTKGTSTERGSWRHWSSSAVVLEKPSVLLLGGYCQLISITTRE